MKDYYLILRLPRSATPEQIKQKYRELAQIYHPDKLAGLSDKQKAHFTEEFREINEAYQILSDPTQKAAYDAELNRVEVSPSSIDFGIVEKGNKAVRMFSVNHLGTPCNIDFSCSEKWLTVTGVKSFSDDETFPLSVEVTAETKILSPQKHAAWIDIDIDGHKGKVSLSITVQQVKPSPTPPKSGVFTFRSGETITSPEELVPLCDKYWSEARKYLYDDRYFKNWFIELRRNDMVAILDACRSEWHNRDVGLEKFLRKLDPSLSDPLIDIEISNSNLGNYDFSSYSGPQASVRIHNKGRGCCFGTLEVKDGTCLSVPYREFAVAPGQTLDIRLSVNSHTLAWESKYTAQLVITNNSQNCGRKVGNFSLQTSRNPEVVEIENLNKEGKWQLALEKVEESRRYRDFPSAEDLKQSIVATRNKFLVSIILIDATIYGLIGLMVGGSTSGSGDLATFGLLGAVLSAAIGCGYAAIRGGRDGREKDYALSILFPGIVAAAIAVIAGLIYFLCIIIIIIGVLIGLAGGG